MIFEATIANRFAFPDKEKSFKPSFINLIATGGIALGTVALILTLSIVQGFSEEIKNKIIGFGSHLHVIKIGGDLFTYNIAQVQKIKELENVASVSPFLQKDVILKSIINDNPYLKQSQSSIEPSFLKAVVPESDISFIRKKMISGTYFIDSVDNRLPLIIGKKLAQKLSLSVGSTLLVISTTKSFGGEEGFKDNKTLNDALKAMRIETAKIIGIYETGLSQGFDDAMTFTTLSAAQRFLELPEIISGYEIAVKDIEVVGQTAADIDHEIGFPLYARTIYQIYQNIFVWLRFQENIIPLLLISVSIVAAFNIISTLLIIVLEKGRQIGVLMSFGVSSKRIKTIFISQSLIMALVGIVIGNSLALMLSLIEKSFHLISISEETYFISNIAISLNPLNYLAVSGFTLLVCGIASLVPAGIAANQHPVQSIRG